MSKDNFERALVKLLDEPQLQRYTCVRMAKRYLERGEIECAVKCLKVDADKLRVECPELYELLEE